MFRLFAAFLIWVGRGWCTWRKRVRVIERDCRFCVSTDRKHPCYMCQNTGKEPYLIRYALFGWLPGDKRRPSWLPNIYLHTILLPDSDEACHNHPWPWARSLILRGWYLEERINPESYPARCNGLGEVYRPGDINRLQANTFHRISEVCNGGMWSLFITSGGPRQPWGFAVPGQGFVPHRGRENTSTNVERLTRYVEKHNAAAFAALSGKARARHPTWCPCNQCTSGGQF